MDHVQSEYFGFPLKCHVPRIIHATRTHTYMPTHSVAMIQHKYSCKATITLSCNKPPAHLTHTHTHAHAHTHTHTHSHAHTHTHTHLFLLSYPMCSGLCLQVVLGVPVRVEYHHSVRSGQVDPQPPGSGGQQETEILGPLSVEVVYSILASVTSDRTIQPLIQETGHKYHSNNS